MSYILFYSSFCKYSRKFIEVLEKSGESTFFIKVCVDADQNGQRPETIYRYSIDRVPTVIVENQKLSGGQAFEWLKMRINNSNDQVNTVSTRTNKQSIHMNQLNQQKPSNQNELNSFNMDGGSMTNHFTEQFQNLDGNNPQQQQIYTPDNEEDIQAARRGNFNLPQNSITSLAMENEQQRDIRKKHRNDNMIRQLPSISATRDKLKEKQFENEYNRLLEERDASVPKPINRC